MADYLVTDTELTSIANAIRTKGSTSASLAFPSGFISAINDIPTGGGDSRFEQLVARGISSNLLDSNIAVVGAYAFASCSLLKKVDFPNCSIISSAAFNGCSRMSEVSIPNLNYVAQSAFKECYSLAYVSFSKAATIRESAFELCTKLISCDFASAQNIYSYAFSRCSNLEIINASKVSSISQYAFQSCSKLSSAYFPLCQSVGSGAFNSCTALSMVNISSCSIIYVAAFNSCYNLNSIIAPIVSTIQTNAFSNCSSLISVSFSQLQYIIGSYTFAKCINLESVSFPMLKSITGAEQFISTKISCLDLPVLEYASIGAFRGAYSLEVFSTMSPSLSLNNYVFANCSNLKSIYLLGSNIVSITTYAFTSSPVVNSAMHGSFASIYVLSSLLSSYKAATNWVKVSDRIVGYSI